MNRHQSIRLGAIALSAMLVCAAGCKKVADANGLKPASNRAKVSHYQMHGTVLGKSAQTNQVVIRQAVIHDYMPETDATYKLSSAAVFQKLKPGDKITGEISVPADLSYKHLTHIQVVSSPRKAISMADLPPHQLLVGEQVPPSPMVNQDGKPTALTDYRGKAVLITFIDTTCTDDCPIISHLFAEINNQLKKNPKAYAGSQLITISINPAHDTPKVLHAYGLKYLNGNATGFKHWEFVHMSPHNLKRLATDFGVSYETVKGDIQHTMDISLIGPDNTLQQSWSGDDWDPKVIARAVEASVKNNVASRKATSNKQTT